MPDWHGVPGTAEGFDWLSGIYYVIQYEAVTSALLGIPDTHDDGQGDSLSTLDLGLCDVRYTDIGLGF
jgi:hypothetical protein